MVSPINLCNCLTKFYFSLPVWIDGVNLPEVVTEAVVEKVVQKAPLVIPEKASSFNVHPERLCMDQCFYCGGKFGLYDTPCHIRAMKSTERQQNILASKCLVV